MSSSGWLTRNISKRAMAEVGQTVLSNLESCLYGYRDELTVELLLLCCSPSELAASSLPGSSGGTFVDACGTAAGRDRLQRHLIDIFTASAPREIFRMFDGRPADQAREAVILGNYVDGMLDLRYWWGERGASIVGGRTISPDGGVTTIAQSARRVLSNESLPPEVRRRLVLALATDSSPQVSAACGSGLRSIPVDANAVNTVRARLDQCGRQACLRILSWVLPEISENDEARRLARDFLRSEFGDVRRKSASALLKDIRREDMTPDFAAMAFEDGEEVSAAIRAAIPQDILEQHAATHLLPKLQEGTLPENQGKALAGHIGKDGAITSAFVSLALDLERGWQDDQRSLFRLKSLLPLLANEQAALPKVLWDTVIACVRRSPTYLVNQEASALAVAHADDSSAHELILHLLSSEEHFGRQYRAAALMSARSPAFEERLFGILAKSRPGGTDKVELLCAVAELHSDQKAQKIVAKALSKAAARKGGFETVKAILHSLRVADWSAPIVAAVEDLAERGDELGREARWALESRVPGTAEALPRTPAEQTRRLAALHEEWASNPPPSLAHPPLEIRTSLGAERFGYAYDLDGSSYLDRHDGPPRLRRSEYPQTDRALAWLGDYEVDPHPDFWLHMPVDLVSVRLVRAFRDGAVLPGRERMIFRFANGSKLEIGLSNLLDPEFKPGDSGGGTPLGFLTARRQKNPHSGKIGFHAMLAVLRANIGLLCKPSADGSQPPEESLVERPRPRSSARMNPPRPSEGGSGNAPAQLSAYHPHRFVRAYQETAFADAFEKNKRSVFKRSPAQRVVPMLGFDADEERAVERRLLLMEMLSLGWVCAGAHVIDLSSSVCRMAGDPEDGHVLREPRDKGTGYVFLGDRGLVHPAVPGKIDGFYFRYMDLDTPGFLVVFTFAAEAETGSGGELTACARCLSRASKGFLPVDFPFEVIRQVEDALEGEGPSLPVEALRAAFVSLHLVQNGMARTIRSRDRGYIPVPYGRGHGSENWLEDDAPVSTYFPAAEGEATRTGATRPNLPTRRPRMKVDPVPDDHDGMSTLYLVEETPGIWKRLKKGDYKGRNGNVVFPQFAGSKLKLLDTTVFLRGKKPAGIASVDPGYLEFNETGSLSDAFRGWVMQSAPWVRTVDQEAAWRVEGTDIAAVRENLLRGERATLLEPKYD